MRWPFSRSAQDALIVEPLTSTHLRLVADIHAQTFARAWTDGEIEDLISPASSWALVARSVDAADKLAGFVIMRSAVDEAEVLSIGVKPSWQGNGVGRMLMDAVLAEAYGQRLTSVFLEVDETNRPASLLYSKLGFQPVAERPDYYQMPDGRRTKAIVMRRDLVQPQ
ncbi:MAG: ribosomal protein S18-alanine N-acetyltransferase [Pseudomonadota bacterium]